MTLIRTLVLLLLAACATADETDATPCGVLCDVLEDNCGALEPGYCVGVCELQGVDHCTDCVACMSRLACDLELCAYDCGDC